MIFCELIINKFRIILKNLKKPIDNESQVLYNHLASEF